MRPIPNTVTDRAALQRVEDQLDGKANRLTGRASGQLGLAKGELLLELAKALARVAHYGQLRKDGEPYTNHLDRVASRLPTVRLRTVAWLHDVLEDTKVDGETLFVLFPRDIVLDVIALTRGFPGEETYREFINRTIHEGSDGALQVKLADLADNLATLDAAGLSSLRARYMRADVAIRAEIKRRIEKYEDRYHTAAAQQA